MISRAGPDLRGSIDLFSRNTYGYGIYQKTTDIERESGLFQQDHRSGQEGDAHVWTDG